MKSLKKRQGFTLIELLVVIAIIGTLATIVMVSLNTARSKARDTRRAADLRNVAAALEMYYDSKTGYPANLDALKTEGYLPSVPTDPKNPATAYGYVRCGGTASDQDYTLSATMENTVSSLLANDVDGTGSCGSVNCADPVYCVEP